MHHDTPSKPDQPQASRLNILLTCFQVAITSPDPDFNTDAKDYFTRHMRILELCTSEWPMADMQMQIDALREAFSADTSRPFELRPGFPHSSPRSHPQKSPPLDMKYQHPSLIRSRSPEQTAPIEFEPQPITPPISVGHDELERPFIPTSLDIVSSTGAESNSANSDLVGVDYASWNPTRIFEYGIQSSTTLSRDFKLMHDVVNGPRRLGRLRV